MGNTHLAEFLQETENVLVEEAGAKGYAGAHEGSESRLADFVADLGLPHAEGEILYKLVRWHFKRNVKDLLKIVSWTFIIWRRAGRKQK